MWQVSSWVPLVNRLLPRDVITIHKRGSALRTDYHLASFEGLRSGWEKGRFSQLLLPTGEVASAHLRPRHAHRVHSAVLGAALSAVSGVAQITALDHDERGVDRGLKGRLLSPTNEQIERMLANLRMRRGKTGTLHTDWAEVRPTHRRSQLGGWATREYDLSGLRWEAKMQPRPDPAGEPTAGAARCGGAEEVCAGGGEHNAVMRARARFAPIVSMARRLVDIQVSEGESGYGTRWDRYSFDEYFSGDGAPSGGEQSPGDRSAAAGVASAGVHAPATLHSVGHEVVSKTFNGLRLHMSDAFPLAMADFLPVFEVLALTNEQYASLERFFSTTLPPGFPVRFSLPVMPAVSATVTFTRCELVSPPAHLFEVPDGYKPDGFRYFGERMAAKEKAGARARPRSGSRDYEATNGHRPPDGRSSHGDARRNGSPRLAEDAAITDDELWS